MAEKPAPAFDRCGIIQGFRCDLKMIQLQKVDLQIVCPTSTALRK